MKRIRKIVSIFLVAFMSLGGVFFASPVDVNAEAHDNVITKLYVKDENGGDLTSSVGVWKNFRVYAEFSLPDNQVHGNDTTTITLPDELLFGNQAPTFEIRDENDNLVANAVCDEGTKTITLTYTDYVDNHSGVKGNLFFYARVDHSKLKNEKDIELKFEVEHKVVYGGNIHYEGIGQAKPFEIRKSGWQISTKNGYLGYGININEKKIEMKDLKFEDMLQTDSTSYVKDSLRVRKGKWVEENGGFTLKDQVDVTDNYTPIWNPDGKSFSIELGDLGPEDAIQLYYEVKVDYAPADGEIFGNKATLHTHDSVFEYDTLDLKYLVAGGSAEGYVYKIKIKKVSEDGTSPLKGAKFKVIRVANNKQVGTLDTNENGEAEIEGLLKDEYVIEETDAPQGYEKLKDPIKVLKTDFDTTKVALKTIKNKKKETSITVTKKWEDSNNQDGKRPDHIKVQLYADGEKEGDEETLSEANQWTKTWSNLSSEKDGKPIKYTVKEVGEVNGYTTTVDDQTPNNIVIKNMHTPEEIEIKGTKSWCDANNQDGKRPEKITVKLFADGAEIATKEVKADAQGNWEYDFGKLPKYKNGVEIKYTVKEEPVEGYTSKVNGYDVKNSYTPGKISVQVTKAWEDKHDQDGKRPASVTIKLLADGKEVEGKTLTLSKANNWTGSFTDLDEYKAGKKIEYTIKEEVVGNGYTSVITGSAKDGYVVTNVRTPKTPPEKPNTNTPKTGDGINLSLYVWLMLISGSLLVPVSIKRRKHGN